MLFIRDYRDLVYFKYDDLVLMNLISEMIKELCDVSTDIESRIMAQVALKDFKNYMKVVENLIGDYDSDYRVQLLISKYIDNNPTYLRNLIYDWLDYWIVKWKQRVKLVWDDKDSKEEVSKKQKIDEMVIGIWRRYPRINEIKELVIGSLIKNQEICFTDVLADNLIKSELYKLKVNLYSDDKVIEYLEKNPIYLLSNLISRVEKLKYYKGYLIILRVDKRIFKTEKSKWGRNLYRFYNWFTRDE